MLAVFIYTMDSQPTDKLEVWAMISFGVVRTKHPSNKNAIAASAASW